jgi:hypothetical protein
MNLPRSPARESGIQTMILRRRSPKPERGFTLLGTMLIVTACAGLAFTYFAMASTALTTSTKREANLRLETTATSAAQLVAQELWNAYINDNGGDASDLTSFRAFIESSDSPVPVTKGEAGALGPEADAIDVLAGNAGATLGHLALTGATVRRRDNETTTDIEVTVTLATGLAADSARATVRQAFSVGGAEFKGFEYSLLTNNVNCLMCHATFDVADRFFNSDASKLGTFDRVKIGTLESLQVRADDALSEVFGTIHSRGSLMDQHGDPLASLTGTTVTGAELTSDGKIVEAEDGDVVSDDLTLAEGDPLPENGQLYLDYPTEIEDMTDGELPLSFPAAIPDLNNNKKIDPGEFDVIAETAHGSLGGTIVGVPDGSTFEAALYSGGLKSEVTGATNESLVLMGTPANPISIDGKVAIDGDVVLFGTVKGEGAIYASGNVYVVGDLTYADGADANGNRTFGIGSDGRPNALALAAGGNILAGDYLTIPNWGPYKTNPQPVTGDGTGSYNFAMNELAIFNRREWSKTQPTLPGVDGSQVPNPGYEAGYVPSYYVLNEGNPVFVMNGANLTPETQNQLYFDPATGLWRGTELLYTYDSQFLQQIDATDPAYSQAVIKQLAPNDQWIANSTLKSLRNLAEALHPIGPMKIDALLYTNSAAFTMLRNQSKYKGRLILNGGLIAADTGVLLPNGFDLNFDPRPSEFVNLWDLSKPVEMKRTVWRRVSSSEVMQ